ncbi:hypothetical protein [Halovenus salina]|uniref:Histidine kinase N-terminal 7TM region domain-containing protein n=1 Tax=Halovenus salina TaxID=1510225 RepID=A0ABD5VY60_9EURY
MSASLTWPVVLSLFAGVATVGLFAYLLTYREKPGASWFAATMVAQAVFLFAYGIGLTVFEEQLRLAFEVVALVGLSWLGPRSSASGWNTRDVAISDGRGTTGCCTWFQF